MISLQPIALLGFVHIVIIISIVLLYWFQTYKRLIPQWRTNSSTYPFTELVNFFSKPLLIPTKGVSLFRQGK